MSRKLHEGPDILGAVTFGLIIILLAILSVVIPTLLGSFSAFILDFAMVQVYPGFYWWAPQNPANHVVLYNAIFLFFAGIIIINSIVLILRIVFRDSPRRQIESLGGIIMSAGTTWAAYNLTMHYNFTHFMGFLIVFAGVSLIISSLGYWLVLNMEGS
ncbi:MAG: hypothetical protein ACFE89_05985 [Candidatus Hodarchaeota archaeon]